MNWSWIWPCDLEVKGSQSNYWTPEIPSHFCLTITPALMKAAVSYCTQPGSPAPWAWVARICPFQTAEFISSPFPDRVFIFLQKGSVEHLRRFLWTQNLHFHPWHCAHIKYLKILGDSQERVMTAHRLFMAPLWLPFDIQDSGLAAGSCHLLPVIFVLVLLCCHHWEWHTGRQWLTKLKCTGQGQEQFCFWLIPAALHPCSCGSVMAKARFMGKEGFSCRQVLWQKRARRCFVGTRFWLMTWEDQS